MGKHMAISFWKTKMCQRIWHHNLHFQQSGGKLLEQKRKGENASHPHLSRVYQIGPFFPKKQNTYKNPINTTMEDVKVQVYNRQSLPVWYAAIAIGSKVHKKLPRLIDLSKKPQNTGKYSAIAWIDSVCPKKSQQKAAQKLSHRVPIPIHSGGACEVSQSFNPKNQRIPSHLLKGGKTIHAYHQFKYCLVMESRNVLGYLSEKLLDAYLAGCLPIYWGNYQDDMTRKDLDLFDIFHPDSMVYFDSQNPQPAISLLKELEANYSEYQRRLRDVPILIDGMDTVDKYFSLHPDLCWGSGYGFVNNQVRTMMDLPIM